MSSTKLLAWSVLAFQIMGAFASPAIPQSSNVLNRAGTATDEFVNTPAGPVLKSKVHPIPEGARVEQNGQSINVIAANGTTLHSTAFTKNTVNRHPLQRRDLQSGYVALAYWGNTDPSPISTFTTLWSVPSVPENIDGQLLYIFNALEPDSFGAILQPVLQFGVSPAGGGNYWSVASWWLIGLDVFHTPITQVAVGQTLVGVMTLQSITNPGGVPSYNYNSVFTGIPASSISISSTEPLPITFEALEIYGATGPTDLPRGRTSMRSIDIVKRDGTRPTVSWSTTSDTAEGFVVSVVSNSVPNGQVDIFYPLQ
ncbi:hypothetical protein CVT25_010479 [Psilocybe cyanescens]|uniref:Uncharacterized protein n=1 Tax=Psilocybe cyanescens TaxID=93625 RepID=A0A409XDD3_PSICY|nr:hypothetical protein CVT25_010479 [Psilocybe cyanescens]